MSEAEVGTYDQSLMGMEDLESMDFSELEENPGFVTPPAGTYHFLLDKVDIKSRNNRKGEMTRNINHIYKILDTVELANSNEKPPANMSLCSERWQTTREGLSYWKPKAKAILGPDNEVIGMKVGDIIRVLNDGGFTFLGKVSQRTSKGDDGKEYVNINITVIERGQELPPDAEL